MKCDVKIQYFLHFAFLSLVETKDFKFCPNWISERLKITKERVSEIISLFTTSIFDEEKYTTENEYM